MVNHRIPKEQQEQVTKVVLHVQKFLPNPAHEHLVYLFEIFNKYVKATYAPDEDITCGACRSNVISKLRYIVNSWTTQKNL